MDVYGNVKIFVQLNKSLELFYHVFLMTLLRKLDFQMKLFRFYLLGFGLVHSLEK
jgi:hypothetical protein